MSEKDLVDQVIKSTLKTWAKDFVNTMKDNAKKINQLTGKGVQSFDHKVAEGSDAVALAIFQFSDYLRLHDMRRVRWGKMPNVDALKEFVSDVGLNKFRGKFVSKYGYTPKNDATLLNSIAWGIGVSIQRKGKWKTKRTKWYNKPRERSLQSLYGTLLAKLSKESLDNLKSKK